MRIKNLRGVSEVRLKKLDSFTLEASKNLLISNFLRNGRLRVNLEPTLNLMCSLYVQFLKTSGVIRRPFDTDAMNFRNSTTPRNAPTLDFRTWLYLSFIEKYRISVIYTDLESWVSKNSSQTLPIFALLHRSCEDEELFLARLKVILSTCCT